MEESGFDVQIATPRIESPLGDRFFEDVLIYAYRRSAAIDQQTTSLDSPDG
jgi:hypothetical protein